MKNINLKDFQNKSIVFFIILITLTLLTFATGCSKKTEPVKTNSSNNEIADLSLSISSPAFENNQMIPAKYTCKGENINPPLKIKGVPKETKSLVIIVEDQDTSSGTWTHWIIWNIPATTTIIEEGKTPKGSDSGINDFEKNGWGGPCPKNDIHKYYFKIYALDSTILLPRTATKDFLEKEIKEHIIDQAELVGKFE